MLSCLNLHFKQPWFFSSRFTKKILIKTKQLLNLIWDKSPSNSYTLMNLIVHFFVGDFFQYAELIE
jgi:hypothetical protein